jgi:hypothetical protein
LCGIVYLQILFQQVDACTRLDVIKESATYTWSAHSRYLRSLWSGFAFESKSTQENCYALLRHKFDDQYFVQHSFVARERNGSGLHPGSAHRNREQIRFETDSCPSTVKRLSNCGAALLTVSLLLEVVHTSHDNLAVTCHHGHEVLTDCKMKLCCNNCNSPR